MFEEIFGKYPQVKVINYVLINPEREYTKKQIAVGADISRVTLDSFIDNLENLNILFKEGTTYQVNLNSKIVRTLIKTQITLAEFAINEKMNNSKEIVGELLSDEEFEKFMDTFDYDLNLENELDKIENGSEVFVTKQDYDNLVNTSQRIFSSDSNGKDITMTQYINENYDKGRINYG